MSISDSVRRALLNADGPLIAKDIRDRCDEDLTSQQVANALNALSLSDEVEVDRYARPFTYVRTKALTAPAAPPAPADDAAIDTDAEATSDARAPKPSMAMSPVSPLGGPAAPAGSVYGMPAPITAPSPQPSKPHVAAMPAATAVARRAAGLMIEHWPNAEFPPPVRQFLLEALGGAA